MLDPPRPIQKTSMSQASIECGQFRSGAQAKAHEDGQCCDTSNPPHGPDQSSWPDLPVAETTIDAGVHATDAWVKFSASCKASLGDAQSMSEQLEFDSISAWTKEPSSNHNFAWAHWSPSWRATLSLPRNDSSTPYKVAYAFHTDWHWAHDTGPRPAVHDCTMNLGTTTIQLPLGQFFNGSLPFAPGSYQVQLDCPRDEDGGYTGDEDITLGWQISR